MTDTNTPETLPYTPTDKGGVPPEWIREQLQHVHDAESIGVVDPDMVDAIAHVLSNPLDLPNPWRTADVIAKMALAWLAHENLVSTQQRERARRLIPLDPALQPVIDALPEDEREMWESVSKGAGHVALLNGPELNATGQRLLERGVPGGGPRLPLVVVQYGPDSMFPDMFGIRREREPAVSDDLAHVEREALMWRTVAQRFAEMDTPCNRPEDVLRTVRGMWDLMRRWAERAKPTRALMRKLVDKLREISADTDGLYDEVADEYDACCVELGLPPSQRDPDHDAQVRATAELRARLGEEARRHRGWLAIVAGTDSAEDAVTVFAGWRASGYEGDPPFEPAAVDEPVTSASVIDVARADERRHVLLALAEWIEDDAHYLNRKELTTAVRSMASGKRPLGDSSPPAQAMDVADEFYLIDTRTVVGNCAMFWRPEGKGYTCDVRDAGLFSREDVTLHRETDLPISRAMVELMLNTHVRLDLVRDKVDVRAYQDTRTRAARQRWLEQHFPAPSREVKP